MVSFAKAVEEVVKSDLRYYDSMRMGIVNYRRLAATIQKDVSRLAGEKPSLGTLSVTLQRLGARMKSETDKKYASIFGSSRLKLMDDITILYIRGTPQITRPEIDAGGFYVKVQGIGSTTVLADDHALEKLEYKKGELLKRISNLSAIVITSPGEIVNTPGVIAQLMMALGGAGINVVEVTSSYDNTFLIIEKKDSMKAVEIIRSLISRARK